MPASAPLYLYDDERARAFEPFALTRPVSELRAGAEVVRRRWETALGTAAAGSIVAPHLADFEELDAPAAAAGSLPAGSIVANARCAPSLRPGSADADVWMCEGRVAAVRLDRALDTGELDGGTRPLDLLARDGARVEELPGRWHDEVWDFIRHLNAQLAEDIGRIGPQLDLDPLPGATVLGTNGVFVERGAHIEPFVVLDVSAGPVLVRRGATVSSFTRLVGPCFVGEHSLVSADKIAACSIGETCRVHGEISSSIVLGHSNKAHDGFVGHSYFGRWVNLGAGTTTSNLKNTYGTVQLWTPGGVRETGMQFLGTLFGDHAKTGIGTRLTTGTVIGAGANVYGAAMPPKVVPPFAWGDSAPYDTYRADKFLDVAARAMARRQITLGERGRRQLAAAHAARWEGSA